MHKTDPSNVLCFQSLTSEIRPEMMHIPPPAPWDVLLYLTCEIANVERAELDTKNVKCASFCIAPTQIVIIVQEQNPIEVDRTLWSTVVISPQISCWNSSYVDATPDSERRWIHQIIKWPVCNQLLVSTIRLRLVLSVIKEIMFKIHCWTHWELICTNKRKRCKRCALSLHCNQTVWKGFQYCTIWLYLRLELLENGNTPNAPIVDLYPKVRSKTSSQEKSQNDLFSKNLAKCIVTSACLHWDIMRNRGVRAVWPLFINRGCRLCNLLCSLSFRFCLVAHKAL